MGSITDVSIAIAEFQMVEAPQIIQLPNRRQPVIPPFSDAEPLSPTGTRSIDRPLTPRLVQDARKLQRISYEELLELADTGAKVVHTRAVEIAARERLLLRVRSSFVDGEGTWVVPEEEIMESTLISGITMNVDEAKVEAANQNKLIMIDVFSPT